MQNSSSLFLFIQLLAVLRCQLLTNAFTLSTTSTLKPSTHLADINPPWQSKRSTPVKKSNVVLALYSNEDLFNEDDAFDVEAARKRLESLVKSSTGDQKHGGVENHQPTKPLFERPTRPSKETLSSLLERFSPAPDMSDFLELPPAPPMTSIERERKETEAELLECLRDGDEVLTDLWDLWFEERGPEALARLREADELTGEGPHGWNRAELILRSLVDEYGIYWSEPVNRLATLYYMQGKLDASEKMCHIVLAVKPWHFGALSGLVMVYAAKHDSENARIWAAHRLPTFAPVGPNRRREQWVTNAVKQAREKLTKAEKDLREAFGQEDEHIQDLRQRLKNIEVNESESWQ